MGKSLTLLFLASLATAAPPRCKVTPAPPDAIFVGSAKRVRLPLGRAVFEDDHAGPRPTIGLVARGGTWLLGIAPSWAVQGGGSPDGRLYEIACGKRPSVRLVAERDGVDFGRLVTPDGGKTWIAGGWGGLVRIDAVTLSIAALTTPPNLPESECSPSPDGSGAPQADVVPVLGPRPGEVTFVRGAPCGYEADFTGRTHVLDLASGQLRTLRNVPTLAEGPDGTLWAGDGAACNEPGPTDPQTPGAVLRSTDGGATWAAVRLVDKPGGTAGGWEPDTAVADVLADRRDPLRVVVRTTLCESNAAERGGSLFETKDGGATWKAIPPPDGRGDLGMGLSALRRLSPTLDRLAVASEEYGAVTWRATSDGGHSWKKLARPPAARPRTDRRLARTLGVTAIHGTLRHAKSRATLAWTTDGIYRRADKDWARVTLP